MGYQILDPRVLLVRVDLFTQFVPKLTLSKHLRDLHSRFDAFYHVYRILGLCHQ